MLVLVLLRFSTKNLMMVLVFTMLGKNMKLIAIRIQKMRSLAVPGELMDLLTNLS
jgi:hypothetical protein